MKRFYFLLLVFWLLAACSPKKAPTRSPVPTVRASATASPVATATVGREMTPIPRVTILPSATPLLIASPTVYEPSGAEIDVTETPELTPTPVPPPTATPRIVDAGATATLRPTATFADSPLPTPSPIQSPLASPTNVPLFTPNPTASETPVSQADDATATPTLDVGVTPSSTPTPTPSPSSSPEPQEAQWRFEKTYTFYDDVFQEFYVMGELVNDTESHWRVTTFWPVVLDMDDNYVTSKDDVDATGSGYKDLREGISLGPGASLSYSFLVYLPDGVTVEDNFDFVIQAELADPSREDLDIPSDDFDMSDWPIYFYVNGTFENPGPDLTEYVALVATLYDIDDQVIGMGWLYETNASLFSTGTHTFGIEVEVWEIVDFLELEVHSYKIQIFGR